MGAPTKLVRDNGVESYDLPPRGRRPRRPLVVATPRRAPERGSRDMRRADDASREPRFDPCRKAFDTALRYGSFG
jgi:hypothetical protein